MNVCAFSRTYGERTVLDFPGFEFEYGKVYAVIGANGSGKSTFGKILAGIEKPDRKCSPAGNYSAGYMPQKSYAFKMSALKNIMLNGTDSAKANELIERLGLSELASSPAKKLSGGETAKLALARIMMKDYKLLILDEPTAAMDMESTAAAEKLMREYTETTGCVMILITHSLQQAARTADHTLFFSEGRLVEHGETAKLLESPENETTKAFLDFFRG